MNFSPPLIIEILDGCRFSRLVQLSLQPSCILSCNSIKTIGVDANQLSASWSKSFSPPSISIFMAATGFFSWQYCDITLSMVSTFVVPIVEGVGQSFGLDTSVCPHSPVSLANIGADP